MNSSKKKQSRVRTKNSYGLCLTSLLLIEFFDKKSMQKKVFFFLAILEQAEHFKVFRGSIIFCLVQNWETLTICLAVCMYK